MNEYEKKLALMSAEEMGAEEYNRIKRLTSDVKRTLELFSLLPEAISEYESDSEAFRKKYDLRLTDYDIKFCLTNQYDEIKKEAVASERYLDMVPESFFRYRQFCINKLHGRDEMRDKYCVPTDQKFRIWRDRQIARCNGDIGGANLSFIHAICCFEMASGCSVGCDFCGLGAKKLTKLFRHTEENAMLFRSVLNILKDRFGIAAGMGMMYLATEPLDNPDYELFQDDYYDIFHYIPQITTAVPDRDIERTRRLVAELNRRSGFVHRFTVRSEDVARKIFDSYTSEELINVELIPQYESAPAFTPYTVVGNEAEKEGNMVRIIPDDFDEDKQIVVDAGTICCIDGFCINFCDKTIKLFTPCHMTEANPMGIAIAGVVSFEDADDFAAKLDYLMDKYIVNELASDEPLKLYSYFKRKQLKKGDALLSMHGGEALLLDRLPEDIGKPVIELLLEGKYNKREIARMVADSENAAPERVFFLLNQLWKKGFIVDTRFFKE